MSPLLLLLLLPLLLPLLLLLLLLLPLLPLSLFCCAAKFEAVEFGEVELAAAATASAAVTVEILAPAALDELEPN